TLTTLQVLRSGEYYQVLDQEVIACLEGATEPSAALARVAERWDAITDQLGDDVQGRTWRKAQGLIR
ncbi:MAG: hypothetical protein AAGA03_13445, partial [Planctomycetota bacterium]